MGSRWKNLPAFSRILLFLLILLASWLPIAAPVYLTWGEQVATPLIVMVYLEFIALIWIWGRYVQQQRHPFAFYGLVGDRSNLIHLVLGFGGGVLNLLILIGVQLILGWQQLDGDVQWQAALGPALLTGIGVGFAEELLFRGWLLTELAEDYGSDRAAWYSSGIYGLLHFNLVKPLAVILAAAPQLPGLILLGMSLATARHLGKGRLGYAIGLHGGMVSSYYVISTTKLVGSTGVVPEWLTGIDGNPLAGVLGVCTLGCLFYSLKKWH
ncbi:MAG: type II CAAX endopeptidase family protein [Pseudanabaenaceae cyanobacterium bins.68]|nr:type II CAAX endopeptidase family protein [Pseudanabaenaceae cyanobacterium bins.68]